MGVKVLLGGYPLGEYDVLIIVEAADDTTAASVALAVTAGGAVKSSRTHPAAEWPGNGLSRCARHKVCNDGERACFASA
jgi:hypothetical protein